MDTIVAFCLIIFLIYILICIIPCKDINPFKKELVLDETKEIVLNGTYISDSDRALYQSFTFKGNSTVVIKDGIFGFDFATIYEKDGNLIRIKTDQSDLLLEIVTPDSLVGEGFAKGSFKKVYK